MNQTYDYQDKFIFVYVVTKGEGLWLKGTLDWLKGGSEIDRAFL